MVEIDRDSGDPPGNGRHYPHRSGGACGDPHGVPGVGDGGPPDKAYQGGSDSSSSEFGT